MAVEPTVLAELRRELAEAPHGTRGPIWQRYAALCQVEVRTLQRQLNMHRCARPGEGRKARSDRGASAVSELVVNQIWAIKEKIAQRDPKRRTISTRRATQLALAEGIITESIPEGTLNRRMTELNLKDPEPVQRFEAAEANEAHQFDWSGSLVFAYHSPGKVIVRDLRERSYKNKPKEERCRVWVFGLKDDHSRVRFMRYFLSPGESVSATLPLLIEAWENPRGCGWLLKGLPKSAYSDNGAFSKSAMAKDFLARFGVEFLKHRPYNSRAKGKIEREFLVWADDFERPFLLHVGEVLKLEDLNARLDAWVRERNLCPHPRRRLSCISVWQASALKQTLRLLPPDAAAFAFKSSDAKVWPDRSLHIDGETYLMPADLVGHKVDIYRNAQGEIVVVDQRTGTTYGIEDRDPLAFGEFKAFAKSDRKRAMEEAVERATAPMPARVDAEAPDNVMRLQPRGAQVDFQLPFGQPQHYGSAEEILARISEVIGRPVAELGDAAVASLLSGLGDNPTKQDVEDMAVFLRSQIAGMEVL